VAGACYSLKASPMGFCAAARLCVGGGLRACMCVCACVCVCVVCACSRLRLCGECWGFVCQAQFGQSRVAGRGVPGKGVAIRLRGGRPPGPAGRSRALLGLKSWASKRGHSSVLVDAGSRWGERMQPSGLALAGAAIVGSVDSERIAAPPPAPRQPPPAGYRRCHSTPLPNTARPRPLLVLLPWPSSFLPTPLEHSLARHAPRKHRPPPTPPVT
jgi:hypothetical protein